MSQELWRLEYKQDLGGKRLTSVKWADTYERAVGEWHRLAKVDETFEFIRLNKVDVLVADDLESGDPKVMMKVFKDHL